MENEIAVLIFEFPIRDKKTGDRTIKSGDLKRLCKALAEIKRAK